MVQQKRLNVEGTNRLFCLIEMGSQPTAGNPCAELKCDHLCLPVFGGVVCKDYAENDERLTTKPPNNEIAPGSQLDAQTVQRLMTSMNCQKLHQSWSFANVVSVLGIVGCLSCFAALYYHLQFRSRDHL